ncbi:MAG: glycosyltransferase family 61 protein [Pseudomonadota bacterium]
MDRDAFVAEVDARLRASAPNVDWGSILNLGHRHRLLDKNVPERFPTDKLPQWLKDALSDGHPMGAGHVTADDILCPAHTDSLRPPRSATGPLVESFDEVTLTADPIRAIRADNVSYLLLGLRGIFWNETGVLEDISKSGEAWLTRYMTPDKARHLPGVSLCTPMKGSNNFVHWLFDFLPRLLHLMESGVDLATFDHFVFFSAKGGIHAETFDLLGIPETKIHSLQHHGSLVQMDHMTHVTHPRSLTFCAPKNYALVKSLFSSGESAKRPHRRLLISRAQTERRRVLNEDAFAARLAPFGFERVVAETLSLKEQVALFSQASHIIAPHGAGLANIAFAPPVTKVLEFYSAFITRGFWTMANQLGHDYHAFACHGADRTYMTLDKIEALGGMWARNHHDIHVPLDDMMRFVEAEFLTR